MMSEESLTTEVPYSFFNIIEMSDIKNKLEMDLPMSELISEYEDMCKSILYYIGFTKDYIPFLYAFNLDSLEDSASIEASDTAEDVMDNSMSNGLSKLMIDAIDDKYTRKELEDIISNLADTQDDIENTIGTLETKIKSLDHNQTFSDYLREKLDNPVSIEKPKRKTRIVPKEEKQEEVKEVAPEKNKKTSNRINIESLFKAVTKTLIAQDEPARRVIAELARKEMDSRKKREGILLTGPTGVGKTELMRLIAKNINRPFFKVDSTQLTIPGYVGKDIEEVLWDLYVSCDRDIEKAEHAIIYFDEIDKKGSTKKSDISGQGVLNVLLPFIEGSSCDAAPDSKSSTSKVKINTSNMTVILGGAYTDVYKNLLVRNQIGFDHEKSSDPVYRKAETKDFVEHGMMTDEFMGRVVVIRLNDLDVNSIKRVMLESDESAMKIQEEIFKKLGVKLTFTDDFTDKVAKKAYEKKTGARGLNGIIDESTWKAFDEVYSNEGVYEEVIINEETVDDGSKYQLIKKKNKK